MKKWEECTEEEKSDTYRYILDTNFKKVKILKLEQEYIAPGLCGPIIGKATSHHEITSGGLAVWLKNDEDGYLIPFCYGDIRRILMAEF